MPQAVFVFHSLLLLAHIFLSLDSAPAHRILRPFVKGHRLSDPVGVLHLDDGSESVTDGISNQHLNRLKSLQRVFMKSL